MFSFYLGDDRDRARSPLATFLFAYLMVVLTERLHVSCCSPVWRLVFSSRISPPRAIA